MQVSTQVTPIRQSTLALLKILALGSREIDEGRTRPLEEVVRSIRSAPAGRPVRS
jgi:hypothetical protein